MGIVPDVHSARRTGDTRPGVEKAGRKFQISNGKFMAKAGNATGAVDQVTHTGQHYDEEDWRNVRFNARQNDKLVNRNWAMETFKI